MAVTIEELYRNYGILADAKPEDLSQHKDAYQVILDGVKGGPKEKRLAAQFIPKFFSSFPELADAAINAQLDLCEDEDVSIRRQAIKELPRFAAGENIVRVADILTQLLQTGTLTLLDIFTCNLVLLLQYFARGLQVYIRQLRVALQGKTGDALKTEENKIKVVALKITNNINVLIKDLFHNPPSYKSTVTLSWKPVQKAEAVALKRPSGEDMGAGSTMKKQLSPPLPRRDARQIYNPPSGKYSATIGNFSNEQRGGFRGGRGRGFGGRGRGRIY
ncbi:unnamed protein product [Oncorhynchus mykiss]|uniref:Apoptosis inhibitor 5 n=1 Tax=Oncorhynchus mykiss TaxID=8022 RepID=A0A060YGQ7_ONCMY|nr:unnamed protein product [Oncorhynchus mykiss]